MAMAGQWKFLGPARRQENISNFLDHQAVRS